MNVLVQHIPHAIPVVIVWGILIRFYLDQRRTARNAGPAPGPPTGQASRQPPSPVRRSVAARGLLALGPLIGALGTGLVIYALNLGAGRAGATAIWTHVGISLLAMLLIAYKIADIGTARLRASLAGPRAVRSGGTIILLALWVPLLGSGVALLISPSTASFTAYAHLIASVWWTGLLLWHLRRYLARATRTVLARNPQPAAPAMRGVGHERARGTLRAGQPSAPNPPRHRRPARAEQDPAEEHVSA